MSDYVNILKQADIFYRFTAEQLKLVSSFCREQTYQLNEIIFSEGSQSNELYLIADGEVELSVDPNLVSESFSGEYQPEVIATLRRGQSFGEISLVDPGLRSASARASQPQTRLVIIPREQLIQACKNDSQLGFRLMYNLAADLALKIRGADLLIRQKILYRQQQEKSSQEST